MLDLRSVILGYESNSSFVQTAPPDTAMLILGIQVHIGELTEQMQIAFPISALEPLIVKLKASIKCAEQPRITNPSIAPKLSPSLERTSIKITAGFQILKMTLRQLAQLKLEDVIEITPEMTNQIQVFLESNPKFKGRLGTSEGRWAIEIDHVLKS
jgi:flagellar motor switch protein FliM